MDIRVLLGAMTAAFLLVSFGIVHCSWRWTIHSEQKPHRFAATTNGMGSFSFSVGKVRKTLLGHVKAEGMMRGTVPLHGNALWCVNSPDERVCVGFIGLKKLSKKQDGKSEERAVIILFRCPDSVKQGTVVTNMRDRKKLTGANFRALQWQLPVTVRRPAGTAVRGMLISVPALLTVFLCFAALNAGNAAAGSAAIGILSGLVLLFFSGTVMLDGLFFRLVFGADGTVTLRTAFHKKQYSLDKLKWSFTASQSDRVTLNLFESGDRPVASVQENCRGFAEAAGFLTKAEADRKQHERWNRLAASSLLIPVIWERDVQNRTLNTAQPTTILTLSDTEGGKVLPVFADESGCRRLFPSPAVGCIPGRAEYLDRYTESFTTADRVVLMLPKEFVELRADEWPAFRSYLEEQKKTKK